MIVSASAASNSLAASSRSLPRGGQVGSSTSLQHNANTPSEGQSFVKGEFFVIGSPGPSNFTTVNIGAPTPIMFRANSSMTVSGAVVNITAPAPMLHLSGETFFQGEITSGAPRDLSFTVNVTMSSEVVISVRTSGTVSLSSGPFYISEVFYFLVNTTDWYDVTHAPPPPGEPYGNNATRVPMTNITLGMFTHAPSQMATNLQNTPAPFSSPFSVTGTIIYFDSEWGGFLWAHHAKIEVWANDCVIDCMKGQTYTDDFGKFTVPSVSANGWRVYAFPEDDVAKVGPGCPAGNCDWAWFQFQAFWSSSPPSGSSIDIGVKAPQGFNEAFAMHNYLLDAQRGISKYGFSQTWRQYAVFDSAGSFTPHTNTPPELPSGVIWFPSLAGMFGPWGPATLYHEYGHALMLASYGGLNYPCAPFCNTPSPHTFETSSNSGFAISEGWAEFMAALIFNSPTCNGCTNFPADKFGNVETNSWLAKSNPPTSDGNIVEGSVASVFWDLNDQSPLEAYSTGGYDKIYSLINFLIGTDKDDNSAEFHSAHRNSMLAVFTDINNANTLAIYGVNLKNLCAVFVGNGLNPQQCQGVVLPTLTPSSFLLVAIMASITLSVLEKKRRTTSIT